MPNLFKRIFKDIKNYKESDLNKNGIYCEFDERNLYNIYSLIIGPKDTPYENGYYFFKLECPSDYPLSPPKVLFLTQGSYIRFNPNLYTNGKVCVSILNTWSGPEWTSSCTLNSVLLSILSLLNSNPIQNEPGWDNIEKNDIRSVNYNKVLKYANVKIAILDMIENPPYKFDIFKDLMLEHLHKNKDEIIKYLSSSNTIIDGAVMKSEIFSLNIKTNFSECHYRLNKYLSIPINKNNVKIFENYDTNEEEPLTESNNKDSKTKNNKIKLTRKAPKENSKFFEDGFQKISENDGKLYEVYLTTQNKKRWRVKKQ